MAWLPTDDILKSVGEGTTGSVFVKDLEGRYVLVNGAFARFVGMTGGEILGCLLGEPRGSGRSLSTLISNLPGFASRRPHDDDWTMLFPSEGARELNGHAPADFLAGGVPRHAVAHPEAAGRLRAPPPRHLGRRNVKGRSFGHPESGGPVACAAVRRPRPHAG